MASTGTSPTAYGSTSAIGESRGTRAGGRDSRRTRAGGRESRGQTGASGGESPYFAAGTRAGRGESCGEEMLGVFFWFFRRCVKVRRKVVSKYLD